MQHTLAAVEKVSIRRKAQDVMLQYNIVEWIFTVLREAEKVKECTLEYTTALLMNLTQRTLGKKRCEDTRLGVLQVLRPLLDTSNSQVRTYINGTLYSIFSSPTIRADARVRL